MGRGGVIASDPALDDLLRAHGRLNGVVGIVAGVAGPDATRAVGAYGQADEGRQPVDADSVFEIGSAEKVFTGTLLGLMVGQGEVALTDAVSEFLPSSVTVPSWKGHPIRLVDLATHTSGLPRLPMNLPMADPGNPLADFTVAQLYSFLSDYTLTRGIGAEYEYSNLGFGLLGHVLARRAGTTFAKLLHDRLLDPLGLPKTSHRVTPAMARRLAIPHDEYGNVVPRWENPTLVGTGGLLSTISDMLTFAVANIEAPSDRLRQAMTTAREPRFTRPDGVRVGLGWHTRRPYDRDLFWISGETGGSRSFIGLDPPRRAAVVLSNSARSVNDIGFHLLDERLHATGPDSHEEIVLPPSVLRRYLGVYELGPDQTITVTASPNGLIGQATGIGRAPLHPQSETEFIIQPINARVTFEQDTAGTVTGLTLHYANKDNHARKTA